MTPLMIEFLTWVASRRRSYAEAMEAWQTRCPRETVWEDALADGLIRLERESGEEESVVFVTPRGREVLRSASDEDAPRGSDGA